MGVNVFLEIFEKSSEDSQPLLLGGKDILLSLVTSAELSYKVNPLRTTEVSAKKFVFLSF